ncbi:putative mitochondrial protein [Vitis vinifera]|uniref:Putative mitochondrial protein n=1 Tax=Vitis vinifera TaxID=29760 RepID=A0A438K4V7_VITVI|nr:putative mitochondrial protein [Vitis vinifera]
MAFSSSASSNVIFAPPNIGHLVSIKLSDTNYLIWSSQIVPVLKSHDLMGFMDGSEPCPSKSLDGSLNPAYILWNKKDQCVLSWINATLSDKVLASVYGITSAREVWSSLANKFASQSRTRVHHLKRKLQTLHQGSMKCTDFLEKAKLVSDELAAVGKPLEDDDLMSYIGRHPPTQLAAMVAHSNAEQEEETWFADSGANQHITANLEHLTLQQPYTGQENVAIGNGQGLSIAHTGTTIFHTPEAKLNLKRVLHCPQASANLLSINQFCLDNNCLFILTGYSSHQNGYRCLDPVTQKVLISRHVVFNENTFPAKDGLQSSELLPVVSSQGTPLPSPSFSLSTSHLQHSSPIISDSPDSPLESLPIPTSPHISTLPSPIPSPAPTLSIPEFSSSSNHSHHPMTTRSQTGNLKPRTFSDFKLYSTHYPLQALSSTVTPLHQPPTDKLLYYLTGEVDRFKARLVALGFAQEEGTDPSLIQSLIQKLQTEFKMKDLGPLGYFLGIQASRDSSGLHLRQSKYIGDLLHRTKMAGAKPASSPCTTGLKLSTHVAAKRVLRYLKGTIDLGLWYTKGEQTLQAFCDSDWAGNPDDRRSTTGGALALASNPVFHARTKHIEVDFHFIREKVANRDISLQFIGSYDQPADIFTKGLSLARFCLLRDKLMVVSLPISLRGDDNHNIQTTEISLASHLSYPPDKCLSTLRDNS